MSKIVCDHCDQPLHAPSPVQPSRADDFTVTGDELDLCLDRAERAEAEVERLRKWQGRALVIVNTVREIERRRGNVPRALDQLAAEAEALDAREEGTDA